VIALDDVLSRLDQVRETARGWSARCPAHHDRSPSLSVLARDGRVISLRCWAGCSYDEILRALDIAETSTTTTTTAPTRPRSPLALALDIAPRQAWYREETRLVYAISDQVRPLRRAVTIARAIAGLAGDRTETWRLLAHAAGVEHQADAIEAELDAIIRSHWRYRRPRARRAAA
jgi:hypothetical protein